MQTTPAWLSPVLAARGASRRGRVASAAWPDARRTTAGEVECIVEVGQRRRWPRAAATRRAQGSCGRSLRCSSSTMCPTSPSSSRLALASQSPCARPLILAPRATSRVLKNYVVPREHGLQGFPESNDYTGSVRYPPLRCQLGALANRTRPSGSGGACASASLSVLDDAPGIACGPPPSICARGARNATQPSFSAP